MSDIINTNTDKNKEKLLEEATSIVEGILLSNPNTSLGDVLSKTNNSAEEFAKNRLKTFESLKEIWGGKVSVFYYILYPFAIIAYIIIYIIAFILYIIYFIIFYIITLSSRLSKLIGDIEFFWDVDASNGKPYFYERFLFIDLLDKDVKHRNVKDNYDTSQLGDEIKEIVTRINTILKNRLQKYKSIIKNLKDKQKQEEEENKALEKWKEYVSNETANLQTKITSDELITLFDNFGSGTKTTINTFKDFVNFIWNAFKFFLKFISLIIGFIIKYAFELLKLLMIVILSFFKSFMQFATTWFGKWTRPFAGFMILLFIIGIIVLSVYFTYETDDVDLDRGGGDFSGLDTGGIGGNNNRKRFTYDENTNIFDALYRLPGEIYSFTNDFTIFYNEILKRITFFMNFSSEIMNDARNFGEDAIEYSRTDNINSEGINDNIYTFDALYIKDLLNKKATDAIKTNDLYKYIMANSIDKKVVHLIKPKEIDVYTNQQISGLKVNIENINGDGEYKIKCDGEFFDKSCKIKQFKADKIDSCNNIDKTPKDTDYNNILL
jgi:gas vesicle protein